MPRDTSFWSSIALLLFVFVISSTASRATSPPVFPSREQNNTDAEGSICKTDRIQTAEGTGTGQWRDAYDKARKFVVRMTLDEKVNITRGFTDPKNTCVGNTGSVPRLDWHGLCLMDGGNGVRATDMVSAWPSGIHVGASWDKSLTYERGYFMGLEFRKKGVNVVLGPSAGPLGRTPLGGRNWEGFSVDPFLSGQLNAPTIKGIQDAGVMANLKHFIANEQETWRRPYFGIEAASSNVDDKTLHEYYLWPFMDGIKAGAASVMCSYNRINNTYACANSKLMNGILKGELGFQGFVLLDWNAQHDLQSANAGLDMVMPQGGSWGKNLTDAVLNMTVTEERVTDMAVRILAAWYLVGQDHAFPVPGAGMKNLTEPHDPIDARNLASKRVLMQGAIDGHVLVKNEHNALPFRNPKMLSVFGYGAIPPASKNVGILFELGYMAAPDIARADLGTEQHFDQAARGGTIHAGGRAGTNSPALIIDPLSAIQHRAYQDNIWVNWDVSSSNPAVNGASEACIVFINAFATEGWDREGLHDEYSDALVMNVASKCANTIVIIHNAGTRLVDQWIEHENVTATIFAHLPGQDAGYALTRLLWGESNFSGKLPYTVAKDESDYPFYKPCGRGADNTTDPQCDFNEGAYLDYRAFDADNITPRFEFGFGLSYTRFEYKHLEFALVSDKQFMGKNDSIWDVVAVGEVTIRNVGEVQGCEVVQLYLGIPDGPIKQLRGFEKICLEPQESGVAHFNLTRRDLSAWDVETQHWVVPSGIHKIFVGASSRDIRSHATLSWPSVHSDPISRNDLR